MGACVSIAVVGMKEQVPGSGHLGWMGAADLACGLWRKGRPSEPVPHCLGRRLPRSCPPPSEASIRSRPVPGGCCPSPLTRDASGRGGQLLAVKAAYVPRPYSVCITQPRAVISVHDTNGSSGKIEPKPRVNQKGGSGENPSQRKAQCSSVGHRVDRPSVVFSRDVVLPGLKKLGDSDRGCDTREPCSCYAQRDKPDIEGQIPCDSTRPRSPEEPKPQRQRTEWVPGPGRWGGSARWAPSSSFAQ